MDMTTILSFIAIFLAVLALIPFALEIWLWNRAKPRLSAKISLVNCTFDVGANKMDVTFLLKLNRGYPAYVRDLQLILPWEAEPYKHPNSDVDYKQEMYLDGSPGTRVKISGRSRTGKILVLGGLSLPLRTQVPYGIGHFIAFHIPKDKISKLELFAAMEIDEAKLGFWAIFYHTRRYFESLTIEIPSEQLDRADKYE
jgi:hypothetical protein